MTYFRTTIPKIRNNNHPSKNRPPSSYSPKPLSKTTFPICPECNLLIDTFYPSFLTARKYHQARTIYLNENLQDILSDNQDPRYY